jgi:23S rRNA pseudouridine2457 synthase
MPRYILFHKPYGVLSQFTSEDGAPGLSDFGLPKSVYPAGRLDKDSEGLLLLTDDGPLIERLLNPASQKTKTYWVLVERRPSETALEQLRRGGIPIEDYRTRPAEVQIMEPAPSIPERDPPVRFRKNVQDFWLEIKLTEGKNRQVRRMTAAVGHPTLRLIRVAILNLKLGKLKPGEWLELNRSEIEM